MTIKTMTVQEVNLAIDSIERRGKKLDHDIQTVGLSILQHIEANREVSLVLKLYNAMPKGTRRNALVEWFVKFGQVQVNLDNDTKKDKPFLFDKARTLNLQGAIETPWFDCKPEKALEDEFDFSAALASLLGKARKARKAGKVIKGEDKLQRLLDTIDA